MNYLNKGDSHMTLQTAKVLEFRLFQNRYK